MRKKGKTKESKKEGQRKKQMTTLVVNVLWGSVSNSDI